MIAAIFGLAPWYVWLLAILAIGGLAYTGLLAPVLVILRHVPWPVWAVLAALAIAAVWLRSHDAALRAEVALERDSYWKAREDQANRDYAAALAQLVRKMEIKDANAQAAATKHARELAANDAKHDARFHALAAQRSTNVTEHAIRSCTLTRGVVLQFNAGARGANGSAATEADEAAAGPGAEPVDSDAGVALDTYASAVEETQRAFGACRNQVAGWQTYHANVIKPWIASTLEELGSCIPKGTP